MKYLVLTLALMFLIGDSVADNPKPSAAYESSPVAKASRDQPEFLIDPWRDKVKPNELFNVRIWKDLPYKVQPEPRRMTTWFDESGHRMLQIMAGEESITIIISHDVIHPTVDELDKAPAFGESREAWVKWNLEHAEDEHYHDSRTVLVEGDGPEPEPDPDPEPDEDPAPIPVDGFRVMVIHERGENKPEYLRSIIAGREVNDYLEKACVEEPNGWAGFRFPDPHEDLSDDPQAEIWVPAMKRPRDSLPWLIISNGTTGFEGPLPKSVDEFLELCKKYEK